MSNRPQSKRSAKGGSDQHLVRLSVSLTPTEADAFFTMLAMSTGEETDADFQALLSIERKFNAARKPNSMISGKG